MTRQSFQKIFVPNGDQALVPADINVIVPSSSAVEPHRQHLLAYLPWAKSYLQHVPDAYHDFFNYVLPYLNTRTTNVHTALSVGFLPELIRGIEPQADANIATLAVILHDVGWSRVTIKQIADSLDYTGVIFTAGATEAKRLHTVYGHQLAGELLRNYRFDRPLTEANRQLIADIALYHERPFDYRPGGRTPAELIIACEADRLWPFTRENFWLDVIRKGVEPAIYIQNLGASIERLMLTSTGRHLAWRLMGQRMTEVAWREMSALHDSKPTSLTRSIMSA